jgi:hypothetical protein
MSTPLWALVFVFTVDPLGALICDVIQGFSHNYLKAIGLGSYLLATPFAAITPILFVVFYRFGPDIVRSNKILHCILAVTMVVLTLFAQTYSYLYLHTDTQAALGFIFGPIYLSIVFVVIAVVLSFGFWIRRKRRI